MVLRRVVDLVVQAPAVVGYCAARFFDRLYPTIPILTPEYVAHLIASASQNEPHESGVEASCVLVAMCAQVFLQAEEPDDLFQQELTLESNEAYGRTLFDAALAAHRVLAHHATPSLNLCLFAFFLYASHARLSHHSQAFIFLRQATTSFLLLKNANDESSSDVLANRLFWVLLVSERAHAIRYNRPITLQITAESPSLDNTVQDPLFVGFWSLAALFRPLDTFFIALLNQEATICPPSSRAESIEAVESAINCAVSPAAGLRDTQKANIRVTQLWLRIIIWQLRLRLGYLTDESYRQSMTYQYPLEVARELVLSIRDLPIDSLKVHGSGLTEKLFDIASVVIDVLARVPLTASSPAGARLLASTTPEGDLAFVRALIIQLPGGTIIYDDLLEKHIQQALTSHATTTISPDNPRTSFSTNPDTV